MLIPSVYVLKIMTVAMDVVGLVGIVVVGDTDRLTHEVGFHRHPIWSVMVVEEWIAEAE